MIWLFAVVALFLLVVSAGFRKFAGVLLALIVVVSVYFYFANQHEKEASRTRIAASELVIDNLTFVADHSSYRLSGRLTNRSTRYSLSDFKMRISMQDCAGEGQSESCVTIGQSDKYFDLQIPPNQARDLDDYVYFTGGAPKAKGTLKWNYAITEIHAKDAT